MPNGKELVLETLLSFCHFESAPGGSLRDNLGVPPSLGSVVVDGVGGGVLGSDGVEKNHGENCAYSCSDNDDDEEASGFGVESSEDVINGNGPTGSGSEVECTKDGIKKKAAKSLTFSQIQWIGEYFFCSGNNVPRIICQAPPAHANCECGIL